MTTDIKIARPDDEVLATMEKWLRENIGPGSYRTIKNGFMGMDDWFYYENISEDEDEEDPDVDADDEYRDPDLVFVFRRESDATVFALKWTTQTA